MFPLHTHTCDISYIIILYISMREECFPAYSYLGYIIYISMRDGWVPWDILLYKYSYSYSFLGYIIVKAYFNYICSCIHNTYLGFIIYNYERRIFPCIIILTIYYYISMRVGYVLVFILEIYNYNSMFFCILTNT